MPTDGSWMEKMTSVGVPADSTVELEETIEEERTVESLVGGAVTFWNEGTNRDPLAGTASWSSAIRSNRDIKLFGVGEVLELPDLIVDVDAFPVLAAVLFASLPRDRGYH